MNAETAKQHLSREPDQMPDLTDMPVSGRSEPRPVPQADGFTHRMVLWGLANGQVRVQCACREGDRMWQRTLEPGHTIEDLVRFAAMHEGPGQPGENKGEPDGLVGPGPVTDFSSPSSPLVTCGHGHADLRCTLPIGHYDQHHADWHGHSISWAADEALFGSESEPGR